MLYIKGKRSEAQEMKDIYTAEYDRENKRLYEPPTSTQSLNADCLKVVSALQIPPPISGHPGIELGNLHCASSKHDEVGDTRGSPVIKVIKSEGVANLVEIDVDVLFVDILHEVFLTDALAPVPSSTAFHARCQPE
jgi:hypothetical protein